MAKKISALIKLALPAGKATPSTGGTCFGQHGVILRHFARNIMLYYEKTGLIIPVEISFMKIEAIHLFLKHRLRLFYWLTQRKLKGSSTPNR
jgi:large subunit ribosomal protein L11